MTDSASKAKAIAGPFLVSLPTMKAGANLTDAIARALDAEWNAGVEAAAQWHDDEADRAMSRKHSGSSNAELRRENGMAAHHRACAAGLRVLKRPEAS